ncbi:MAG: tyrosine-type recombinase/integrase [Planctomycetia bacterium]|nr:tyrosine-type recombinase/integrase [Planctomycetia bacterium]
MIAKNMTIAEICKAMPEAKKLTLREVYRVAAKADGRDVVDTMTLTEFYVKCYKPDVSDAKDLADDTYRQRERALKYWVEVTGNPALCDIDKQTMINFVREMRAKTHYGIPLSSATIKKRCAALMSILSYAGPKTEKNRDAKELIPMPPAFPPVHVYLNPTAKTPSKEEVQAVVKATEVAEYPKLPEISAPQWWRCAYLFLALTGVRKGDLLGMKWGHVRQWEGMWCVVIPAEVEKTGVEKVIPLSTVAQDVLNQMPRGRPEDHIFQWPHSASTFTRQRRKIVRQARLSQLIRGTWHAMRRFVATMVQDAQLVLGHTSAAITRLHYQSMTRAAVALEAMGNLLVD